MCEESFAFLYIYIYIDSPSGKASRRTSGARGLVGRVSPQKYLIQKFVAGLFGLDSFLVTDGGILDPCYEMWE